MKIKISKKEWEKISGDISGLRSVYNTPAGLQNEMINGNQRILSSLEKIYQKMHLEMPTDNFAAWKVENIEKCKVMSEDIFNSFEHIFVLYHRFLRIKAKQPVSTPMTAKNNKKIRN